MTTVEIPQYLALRLQLAAIAGREPAGGLLEIRYKTPGGMAQVFHDCRRPDPLAETIIGLGRRTDTYIGCAPRRQRHGGKDSIERVWSLWADVDGPDGLERLRAFEPTPHMIVASGSPDSVHAWWDLREPATPRDAERANRRLAHHLGADMRATDAARILRPAGTLNHKHDPPAPVVCIHLDARRALTVAEALAAVPELAQDTTPDSRLSGGHAADVAARSRSIWDVRPDPLRAIPATEYVPALTGRPVGRDGKAQCPFHGGGQERTPSLHAYPDDGGWCCFGCAPPAGQEHLGGDIYVFGAMLYGLDHRRDFPEIRRRLACDLLGAGAVAA